MTKQYSSGKIEKAFIFIPTENLADNDGRAKPPARYWFLFCHLQAGQEKKDTYTAIYE